MNVFDDWLNERSETALWLLLGGVLLVATTLGSLIANWISFRE